MKRRSTTGCKKNARRSRRGATVVEFAVIAGPLFLTIFASVEFARAMMVRQTLEEASRAACRVAILDGAQTQEVEQAAASVLHSAGVSTYQLQIEPPLGSALKWAPVTVSLSVNASDVSWLPVPNYVTNKLLFASCTLPREGGD